MPSSSVVFVRPALVFLLLLACPGLLAGQPIPPSPFGEPHLVADLAPGGADSGIEEVCRVDGTAFEDGADRLLFITGADRRLWVTDGTPGGTFDLLPPERVADFFVRCDGPGAFVRTSPSEDAPPGPPSDSSLWLWWSDGTAAGTHPLADAYQPVVSPALPDGRHLITGAPWVAAGLPEPASLWVTDRTPGGTVRIPLPADADGFHDPGLLARLGDLVLIAVDHLPGPFDGPPPDLGDALWISDGTAAGTTELSGLGPEDDSILEMRTVGDEVALLVRPLGVDGQVELWMSDGTASGTRRVPVPLPRRSPFPGASWILSTPDGERLVFVLGSGTSDDDRQQLWVTDGTAAGTARLAESDLVLNAPPFALFFHEPVPFGDRFYFTHSDPAHGDELWESDLTPEGTEIALDLCPGPCSSSARPMAPYGDRVLLSASLPETGSELWVSDLTPAGTRLVADLCTGPCSSLPESVVRPEGAGGWTLFATRPLGFETPRRRLWRLPPPDDDRSPLDWPPPPAPVTGAPAPVEPGSFGELPLVVLDRQVLFVRSTAAFGSELWSLPFTDAPPPPPPGEPVESRAVPGFRLHVRISAGPPAPAILGTLEPDCLPETACFSGALPERSEVFVRMVGPKPNGFLWPTLVKFTTSTVEVWIERIETGEMRYYVLPGARPGFDELPGLFDRTGFPD